MELCLIATGPEDLYIRELKSGYGSHETLWPQLAHIVCCAFLSVFASSLGLKQLLVLVSYTQLAQPALSPQELPSGVVRIKSRLCCSLKEDHTWR